MSEQHPLQSFIDLVTFDQELVVLEREITKLEHALAETQNKFFQIEQTLEQAKNREVVARKEVDAAELEMKEIDARCASEKERLDNVKNAKEYQAVKTEIEKLKHMQSDLDETLLDAWKKFESVKKEYEVLAQESETKIVEYRDAQEKTQQKIAELKHMLSERRVIRSEKEKGVPADWLERYAMMRSRATDPVVPVLNSSCSACFWPISQQDMLTLKRGVLLQCKGCYRFLYMPKEQPLEQEK